MKLSCAAGQLRCTMPNLPLQEGDTTKHTCFHCKMRMHAPCGFLWEHIDADETDKWKAVKDKIGTPVLDPKAKEKIPFLEICSLCISRIEDALPSTAIVVTETSATAATAKEAPTKKVPSTQVLLPGAPKPKKTVGKTGKSKEKQPAKKEHSVKEKLDMAKKYKCAIKGTKGDLARKWCVSSSTLTRWVKDIPEMERQVEQKGRGAKKTVLRKPDPLGRIKDGLAKFYETNKNRTKHFKIPITARVLSVKAATLRDELLDMHKNNIVNLTDEEVEKMKNFQASESWAKKVAKDRGWKSKALHGEAGGVDYEAAAPQILLIRRTIHGNVDGRTYRRENVYNMDETGLLYKCLPNRSYVSEDEVKTARGTKLMKAKDRVTLYVCTNADGSDFVPLSIIGSSEKPRCFRNHEKKLTYYNQKKAWSDMKTSKKWFADFVKHVKRRTNDPILLIMDNCAAHNDDTFKDVSGQVRVIFLPPNCTSVYQPMDCGVIAMIKKRYRHRLLLKLLDVYNDMMTLFEQNKGRTRGTNGLDEGYAPHLRDCMDILAEITPEFTPEKIRNCWEKSTLLDKPPADIDPTPTDVEMTSDAVAANATSKDTDVEMGVVDAADASDDSIDMEDDDAVFKAIADLAELAKKQKGGAEDRHSGRNWEMVYILQEMVEAVEGIDCSDPEAMKELLNGWVSMEETPFCREAFADEAETDLSPTELLECNDACNNSDDEESAEEAEAEICQAKKDDIDVLTAKLRNLAAELEKLEGFNLCAGKVTDAANFTASTWRKTERDRIGEKQKKPSRQAGIQPFLFKSKSSEKDAATESSLSSKLPAAAAKESQLIDLSMEKTVEDVSAASSSESDSAPSPAKPYKRNENAFWIASQCRTVGSDTKSMKQLVGIVLSTLEELKSSGTGRESMDVLGIYMKAFSDEKSNLFKENKRDMQFIHSITEKSEELMDDESLTVQLLDATFFNEFMLV